MNIPHLDRITEIGSLQCSMTMNEQASDSLLTRATVRPQFAKTSPSLGSNVTLGIALSTCLLQHPVAWTPCPTETAFPWTTCCPSTDYGLTCREWLDLLTATSVCVAPSFVSKSLPPFLCCASHSRATTGCMSRKTECLMLSYKYPCTLLLPRGKASLHQTPYSLP
ncbi:hypothetical protein COCMIDRAFT_104074 [Bipolaris oryzae ATCC 44560]|uniref:Uncharacterized protein n=1 Tax=Bipolaris oryzae ATCC 44560 TaxID=930090 RepID=W6ZFH5_COCMI|nr:uncharacterized protein COCMIDRAFT_104074 [Bipolaris oryzae ATCC 44560]EUC42221.1 hypothetical protein COCMIDRAFT_104074 [Bipolaris oryzae ATCC 44560]